MVILTNFFCYVAIMKTIVIASFYQFVSLEHYETLREPILNAMQEHGIKGTILLASEGINGSFAGERAAMDSFYAYLRSHEPFKDLRFKETFDAENPFEKTKVKLRKEIVTMGVCDVNPLEQVGVYLSPEEWHQLIQDPDVVLIDTRNDYEYELGTFKNAINPDIENFREFPEYVRTHLADKKDKKVAMFCTGGIRCEKTTTFMLNEGFKEVYHLQDGILNYLEQIPEEESLWEGSCFVFDNRVAVTHQSERVQPQLPLDYKYDRPTRKNSGE